MADFTSAPFSSRALRGRYARADVEIHGVDQVTPSYEGRIFLDNPNASRATERSPETGFVGAFHVFGKAGCWGEEGHCDTPATRRRFDRRRDPTRYAKFRVTLPPDLAERVERLGDELTLSIVAAVPAGQRATGGAVLRFERLSIVTYG